MKARLMVLAVNAALAFAALTPIIKSRPTWTDGN
jgi:hypothetical protein